MRGGRRTSENTSTSLDQALDSPAVEQAPVLELHALTKRYGSVVALSGLDLSVAAGEIYGFLGRNGAGKSTAIRAVMGITHPTSGTVRLFGEEVTRQSHIALRQRVGYVAQDQTFYGWMTPKTLGRFVRGFYPTWDDANYANLLRRMDLPEDRRVGTFSGGMKAKVALALALAHSPRLLVLDEPTAGLDPVARREFLEMIRDEAARTGATTFFSTHLIDEIDVAANRVGIVDGGVTRYEGTVSDLMARHRLVAIVDPEDTQPAPPALANPAAFRVVAQRWHGTEKRMLVEAADPAAWSQIDVRPWQISSLPLEELFIEMVRRPM